MVAEGDFTAKLGIVEEEADETLYWLEIIAELGPESKGKAGELYKEMNEIPSIVIASRKTATRNQTTGI
jgi:four helix bundle protein